MKFELVGPLKITLLVLTLLFLLPNWFIVSAQDGMALEKQAQGLDRMLLGLALPGTALAYWLWYRVLGEVELNRANSFSFLVPIFGLAMGVVFYQESISVLTASGIILTVLGIVLVNWPGKKTTGREA